MKFITPFLKTGRTLCVLTLCSTLAMLYSHSAGAVTTEALNCASNFQIVQSFANQGKWEMCWEPKAGYGYKLSQVIFTPPNGVRRKILGAMHAAQLFVPYDDNGARYHDISYGINMATLTAAECPGGTLLTNSVLCLTAKTTGYAYKNLSTGSSRRSDSFDIFGYYGVGNYYYTFKYSFYDDGSIEPAVLASGSLQRYGGTSLNSWPIGSRNGINHNHLIIWRLDFDLDGAANNLVEQIEFNGSGTDNRSMSVIPLTSETKTTNDLTKSRFWRVRNTAQTNTDGRAISYEIEPSVTDQLRAAEDFTQNDFYLTQNHTGEDLVDKGLVSFVNGETITDAVLWYGVDFHHVPRGEDDVKMPAHSQGFRIRPRDITWTASTTTNNPPIITNPGNQSTSINTAVNLQISASDVDATDVLTYSASGLPTGLSINSSTGAISGTLSGTASTGIVTVNVSDGHPGGSVSTTFTWTVTVPGSGGLTFSNPSVININDKTAALPYPASVNVSGLSGTVSKVTVTLNGLSHTYPSDIDLILVGPSGQKAMLMSDAGAGVDINNATITFDSSASVALAQTTAISNGTYKPTDYLIGTTDSFPTPAPAAPYTADLNVFNGLSPNGSWSLYILDDASVDSGQILNGFTVAITTTAPPTDTTPPTVMAKTPANGTTGIALNTIATAQFSEAMLATTITTSTFTLQGPNGLIPATVAYNAANLTATLTPQSPLAANTTYTASVKSGNAGIKDLAANPLAADMTWSFTTQSVATGTATFTAPAAITIRDNTTASIYPVVINVNGMSGTVSRLSLTLNGLSHTYPGDIDIILVGPSGQKSMLMSDAGGGSVLNNVSLTFDTTATLALPQNAITSGTYKATNYALGTVDKFPTPGPVAPFPANLSLFNGTSPNGNWSVYIVDMGLLDAGTIASGITLKVTTN